MDEVHSSIGLLSLRLPRPNGTILLLDADIVRADIPVIMRLDVMQRCGLILDFNEDDVPSSLPYWKVPIIYQFGHTFIVAPYATNNARGKAAQYVCASLAPWARFHTDR